jgi:hypothetical protein
VSETLESGALETPGACAPTFAGFDLDLDFDLDVESLILSAFLAGCRSVECFLTSAARRVGEVRKRGRSG